MALFPDLPKKKIPARATTFSERVVALALKIPSGRVVTYRELARAAGGGGMAARSITGILGKAYTNGVKEIPFHRIVYSSGKVWINSEYRAKRMKLYKTEGISVDKSDNIKNFADIVYEFPKTK